MESAAPLRNIPQPQQVTTHQPDQPTPSTLSSNRVVVFADMLGFAALTEANAIDLRMLHAHSRPLSMTLDDILRKPRNPLTEAFSRFHNSLKWAIQMAEDSHPLTAITFSDSVFIATNYLFEATSFAVNLAQAMLSQKVPVRMGIAFGSFAALSASRSSRGIDDRKSVDSVLAPAGVRA